MVHRHKNVNIPPSALIAAKWDSLRNRLLEEMHLHEADPACYRDTTIDALCFLYKEKCAFCERKRGTELQVDHYRPKKARNNIQNPEYNQSGYYWLAYTWSNLIPVCSKCNNLKSSKFPLSGWVNIRRIDSHTNTKGLVPFQPYDLGWLQAQEQPLLINPEHEMTPEKHFIFLKNGSIRARTPEGEETINICQLNRKDLRRERVEICQEYVTAIKQAIDEFSRAKNRDLFASSLGATFRQIRNNIHIDKAHSLFHVYVYRYFDLFIAAFLPEILRDLVTRYFNDFKHQAGI